MPWNPGSSGKNLLIFFSIFIFVIILVPLVKPTNVQVNSDSITGTSATITWTHVETSPSSILGFFRGYRVRSHTCMWYYVVCFPKVIYFFTEIVLNITEVLLFRFNSGRRFQLEMMMKNMSEKLILLCMSLRHIHDPGDEYSIFTRGRCLIWQRMRYVPGNDRSRKVWFREDYLRWPFM